MPAPLSYKLWSGKAPYKAKLSQLIMHFVCGSNYDSFWRNVMRIWDKKNLIMLYSGITIRT